MKKLLFELDTHVHWAFKQWCFAKNSNMKTELTKYVLAVIRSDLNITTEDVIKSIVQKERKRLWDNALKEYNEKKEIKKGLRERKKARLNKDRQEYEDRWEIAQDRYNEKKITKKRNKLRDNFNSLKSEFKTHISDGFFYDINKDINQCEDLVKTITDFNKENPFNELKLELVINLLEVFKEAKKDGY